MIIRLRSIFVCLLFAHQVFSQSAPPLEIIFTVDSPPTTTVDVDVSVKDFNDIVSMQFLIFWDSTVLSFASIENVTTALPDFNAGNIGTPTNTAQGIDGQVSVSWSQLSTLPFTLPDSTTLFTIRLNTTGAPCDSTEFTIGEILPFNLIEVINDDFEDIGAISSGATVTIPGTDCMTGGGEDGVGLIASDESGLNGANVCVEVSVVNFDSIQSAQGGVMWDPAIVTYTAVQNFGLPGLSQALFNVDAANGMLSFLWFDNTGANPVTLPDGSVIFEICYDIIGNDGQVSPVKFINSPNIEFSGPSGQSLDFYTDDGSVTVGESGGNTDFGLVVAETPVPMGGNACVDVTTVNFTNIGSIQYSMTWNDQVLTYTGVTNLNSQAGLSPTANFFSQTSNSLNVSWNSTGGGLSLPDGTLLYSVCFDVIGDCDETTTLEFVGMPLSIEIGDPAGNPITNVSLEGATVSVVCGFTITASITEPACFGELGGNITVSINGGQGNLTCEWTDANGNPISTSGCNLFGQAAGQYTLTVTDEGGMTTSETFIINQPDPLVIDGQAVNADCSGFGSISCTVSGGTQPYTTSWSPEVADENMVPPGFYTKTVVDANNCTDDATFFVGEGGSGMALQVSAQNIIDPSCDTGPGSVNLVTTGGCSPYTCMISVNGATPVPCDDITSFGGGNYSVTVTDDLGDTATTTFSMTGVEQLALQVDFSDAGCNGEGGDASFNITGGCTPYTCLISYNGGTALACEAISEFLAGNYSVTVTDNQGSQSSASFVIAEPEALSASATVTDIGPGVQGSVNLTVTGGTTPYTYSWFGPSGFTAATEDLSGLVNPGCYDVTIVDANGCTVSYSCIANVMADIPTISVSNISVVSTSDNNGFGVSCLGECDAIIDGTIVTGTPPYSITLTGGGSTLTFDDFPLTGNICAGTYTLDITDSQGAEFTQPGIEVTEPPQLTIALDDTECSDVGQSNGSISTFVNGGVGQYSLQWSPSGGNAVQASNLSAGNYLLSASDGNGCIAEMLFTVDACEEVDPTACYQGLSVMTPNGDGYNDLFMISCAENNPSYLQVFDRWGRLVHEAQNYSNNWDGTDTDGEALGEGAYFWVLEVTFPNNTVRIEKGTVTLLRN